MEKRLLDINGLAEYICLRPQSIRDMLSAGTFPIRPTRALGRKLLWDRKGVDRFLDKARVGP